jgi:WXG100 family type VII secretion target
MPFCGGRQRLPRSADGARDGATIARLNGKSASGNARMMRRCGVANETTFDRSSMATAATQVESTVGQIKALQSRLNGAHGDLMGGWVGQSASAFTAAFNEFNADFTKVIQALDFMHEKLVVSRTNYNASEDANATSASRISAALNR